MENQAEKNALLLRLRLVSGNIEQLAQYFVGQPGSEGVSKKILRDSLKQVENAYGAISQLVFNYLSDSCPKIIDGKYIDRSDGSSKSKNGSGSKRGKDVKDQICPNPDSKAICCNIAEYASFICDGHETLIHSFRSARVWIFPVGGISGALIGLKTVIQLCKLSGLESVEAYKLVDLIMSTGSGVFVAFCIYYRLSLEVCVEATKNCVKNLGLSAPMNLPYMGTHLGNPDDMDGGVMVDMLWKEYIKLRPEQSNIPFLSLPLTLYSSPQMAVVTEILQEGRTKQTRVFRTFSTNVFGGRDGCFVGSRSVYEMLRMTQGGLVGVLDTTRTSVVRLRGLAKHFEEFCVSYLAEYFGTTDSTGSQPMPLSEFKNKCVYLSIRPTFMYSRISPPLSREDSRPTWLNAMMENYSHDQQRHFKNSLWQNTSHNFADYVAGPRIQPANVSWCPWHRVIETSADRVAGVKYGEPDHRGHVAIQPSIGPLGFDRLTKSAVEGENVVAIQHFYRISPNAIIVGNSFHGEESSEPFGNLIARYCDEFVELSTPVLKELAQLLSVSEESIVNHSLPTATTSSNGSTLDGEPPSFCFCADCCDVAASESQSMVLPDEQFSQYVSTNSAFFTDEGEFEMVDDIVFSPDEMKLLFADSMALDQVFPSQSRYLVTSPSDLHNPDLGDGPAYDNPILPSMNDDDNSFSWV